VQVAGHDVRTAFEGTAVVEMALEYRPHVVLLDIGLPGLTGLEVAVQLRQQPILKDAVLIAMTGYGRQGDRERSTAAGFAFHLVKPADILQVLQILADVAKRIHLED
ncbi:MAG: response regulator, partial [Planctomycetota bacterium]|nr:response regulator [Planctomycetota bacterium]